MWGLAYFSCLGQWKNTPGISAILLEPFILKKKNLMYLIDCYGFITLVVYLYVKKR